MKEKRYYYGGAISVGKSVLLEGEEAHHLINVMRQRVSERVCLFNGNGNFYFGNIKSENKKSVEIEIVECRQSENEPTVQIDVFQALAKGDKLSLIMQKITELGATNLFLFESKFCDVKAQFNKRERMDLISVSAAKQCSRATIVSSSGIFDIDNICKMIAEYDAFIVAYENETGETLADFLSESSGIKKIAIMIGPEGGFSEDEIQKLRVAGAVVLSLGKRILRTETAAIASTAIISAILKS